MQRHHVFLSLMVTISIVGALSLREAAVANEPNSSKLEQQQLRETQTTKSKLETKKKGEAEAFKELNRHAPGGPDAAPDVKGTNKSGGSGTGTGAGTGTTGASGGSGSGGSGGSGGGGS